MPAVCSVLSCRSRQQKNQPLLTFHRMPRNSLREKRWIDVLGKTNINNRHKRINVCSLHFSECSFNRTLDVIRLKDDAIPLNPHNQPKKKIHQNNGGNSIVTQDELPENDTITSHGGNPIVTPDEFPKVETITSHCLRYPQTKQYKHNKTKNKIQPNDGGNSLFTSDELPKVETITSHCLRGPQRKQYKICRVCMTHDATEPALSEMKSSFIDITGINLYQDALKNDLPIALCDACWEDFHHCLKFVENAQNANKALYEMKRDGKLSLKSIKEAAVMCRAKDITSSMQKTATKVGEVKPDQPDDEEGSDTMSADDLDRDIDIQTDENSKSNEDITIYYTKSEEEISDNEPDDISATHSNSEQALVKHLLHKINKTSEQTNIKTINANVIDKEIKEENTHHKEVLLRIEMEDHNYCNFEVNDIEEFKMDLEINETELSESVKISDNTLFSELNDTPEPSIQDERNTKDKMVMNRVFRRRTAWNPAVNFPHKDMFQIQILSLNEQKAEVEKRMYSDNYINSPFKCNDCYKGFLNEMSFERHRQRHSEKWGEFQCEICKHRFTSAALCSRHRARHRTLYKCKQCPYTMIDRSHAIRHALEHKGKNSYQCQHCGIQFSKSATYLGHLRIKHVTKFACEFCGFSFLNDRGLEIHKNFRHRFERDNNIVPDGPACSSCNIKFASDDAFNTHMRVCHPKSPDAKVRNVLSDDPSYRSFKCELCGEFMKNHRFYRRHFLRTHPGKELPKAFTLQKAFMCEQCGRVFVSQRKLKQHAILHADMQPNQCHKCGKQCLNEAALELHTLAAHRKQSMPKYAGPEGNNVLYPCSICGKEFTLYQNSVRHMMVVHTGLRPFQCEICRASFKTKAEVKAHTKHVHLKVPWPKKKSRAKVRSLS